MFMFIRPILRTALLFPVLGPLPAAAHPDMHGQQGAVVYGVATALAVGLVALIWATARYR